MSFLSKLFNPIVIDQLHNIFIALSAIFVAYGVSQSSPVLAGIAAASTILGSVSSAFNVKKALNAPLPSSSPLTGA